MNRKQTVFVCEYLKSWNATEAATAAGYAHPRQAGSRLLSRVDISHEIAARVAEKGMAADEVLLRLAEQARSSMADFLGDDGAIDLKRARENGVLGLLKSVSQTSRGERIELYDAQSALALLGKAHGLFIDRQELTGSIQLNVVYTNPLPGDPDALP